MESVRTYADSIPACNTNQNESTNLELDSISTKWISSGSKCTDVLIGTSTNTFQYPTATLYIQGQIETLKSQIFETCNKEISVCGRIKQRREQIDRNKLEIEHFNYQLEAYRQCAPIYDTFLAFCDLDKGRANSMILSLFNFAIMKLQDPKPTESYAAQIRQLKCSLVAEHGGSLFEIKKHLHGNLLQTMKTNPKSFLFDISPVVRIDRLSPSEVQMAITVTSSRGQSRTNLVGFIDATEPLGALSSTNFTNTSVTSNDEPSGKKERRNNITYPNYKYKSVSNDSEESSEDDQGLLPHQRNNYTEFFQSQYREKKEMLLKVFNTDWSSPFSNPSLMSSSRSQGFQSQNSALTVELSDQKTVDSTNDTFEGIKRSSSPGVDKPATAAILKRVKYVCKECGQVFTTKTRQSAHEGMH